MIKFLVDDEKITTQEISSFIDQNDNQSAFDTRLTWQKNFLNHFNKIIEVKQVLSFRDEEEKLYGICSWAMTDEDRKKDINKIRWLLPENITDGDILYIDVCLLRDGASIFKIKNYLKSRYQKIMRRVFWYNVIKEKTYSLNFKGENLCQKV